MIRLIAATLLVMGCPMVDDTGPPPSGDNGDIILPCEESPPNTPGCPQPHDPEVLATPQRLPGGFTDRQGNTSWR